MSARDLHGRPLRSLRLSVTDRCNLRCAYCMPEPDYTWLPRADVLTFEELAVVARAAVSLGVRQLRITGGEPLVRRDLPVLIAELARIEGLDDLALTTNGVLLAEHAAALRNAGLRRITVSLDTLSPGVFQELTRRDDHARVLHGIAAARDAGLPLKLDAVILRGVNDGELEALLDYARAVSAELRFIEYMDVGGATRWEPARVVSRRELLERLAARGAIDELPGRGSAPAARFRRADGTVFGIVSSTTEPFCGACDRARVTADGTLFTCLYAKTGLPLRPVVRGEGGEAAVRDAIATAWAGRSDRGAEHRLRLSARAPLLPLSELRADVRLEMHTRGG